MVLDCAVLELGAIRWYGDTGSIASAPSRGLKMAATGGRQPQLLHRVNEKRVNPFSDILIDETLHLITSESRLRSIDIQFIQ